MRVGMKEGGAVTRKVVVESMLSERAVDEMGVEFILSLWAVTSDVADHVWG